MSNGGTFQKELRWDHYGFLTPPSSKLMPKKLNFLAFNSINFKKEFPVWTFLIWY